MPAEKHSADEPLLPALAETDWDGIGEEADAIDPDDVDIIEELAGGDEDDEISEEDDDNPYQDSDEALPDDEEEAAISKDLWREGDERFHDS